MFKVLVNLKHDGTDYQKGDVLEIDEERGMVMVEHGILEFVDKETPVNFRLRDEEEEKVNYEAMTVQQLKEIAEEKGINVKGLKKGEIIEALENPEPENEEEENDEEGEEGESETNEEEDDEEEN